MRRRSLRQALAEPSTASFTSNASSGGSAGSRHSLAGDLPAMGSLEEEAAAAAAAGPSAAAVAAALLQRHGSLCGSAAGLGSRGPSRGQSTASMELDLGEGFQGLQGRLRLSTDEREACSSDGDAGAARGLEGEAHRDGGGGQAGGGLGSPLGSKASYSSSGSSSEQGSSSGTRLTGEGEDDEEEEGSEGAGGGSYLDLLGSQGEDPFAEFDQPPDPAAYRALHSATTSPEKGPPGVGQQDVAHSI